MILFAVLNRPRKMFKRDRDFLSKAPSPRLKKKNEKNKKYLPFNKYPQNL
jgi:hypothetical protein